MTRRTRLQSTTDDLAFPVRLTFKVPGTGLGAVSAEIHNWLRDKVGTGRYAVHGKRVLTSDGIAVYFVQIVDALRFAEAFADVLQMADGTLSSAYNSAYKGCPPLKWKEPLNMDTQMLIDAARELSARFDRSLQNPQTPHVILTRDEAILTQGLIEAVRDLLEREKGGEIVSQLAKPDAH